MPSARLVMQMLAAAAMLMPIASHADQYKWCAHYGARDDGGINCGFITYEQCLATISGVGGICQPNPFYTGPETTGPERRRPRKRPRK